MIKWDDICEAPKDLIVVKKEGEKEFKTIEPIHKIKKATEILGVYGKDWGIKNIKHTEQRLSNSLILDVMTCVFYAKEENIEFEISNSTPIVYVEDKQFKVNHSYMKAIETDTICKALSRLGLYADIYSDIEYSDTKSGQEEINPDDLVSLGDIENEQHNT